MIPLAIEARRMTEEIVTQHKTEELQKIEEEINKQINAGKFGYSYEGYISPEAKQELIGCGYDVYVGSQYNQRYVKISW